MQQDAEELYSSVMTTLSQNLKEPARTPPIKAKDHVIYTAADGTRHDAVVVKVHDDPQAPYYTVSYDGPTTKDKKAEKDTSSNKIEKQTDAARLEQVTCLARLLPSLPEILR